MPRNQGEVAQLLPLYEALFGKTTFRVGPTNSRWTTFSGEMSPESITDAIDLANTGQPYLYMDMCRRAAETDAAIGASCELAFSSIVAEQDRIEPRASMRRYKLAISLANWLRAVREQIEDFDKARYALLWAEGVSYTAAENIYGRRTITWFDADGKRHHRPYVVPVKLEIVDGRAFRFDTETDDPLLWIDGGFADLPPAKFIFHTAYRFSSLKERGGFMRSCLYLHMAKQAFLRDMSIYGHEYGLQQMVAEYDRQLYSYPEARQIITTALANRGEGGIPIVPMGAMNLRNDAPPVQGELIHGQAAQLFNAEIFRRITLGLLTMMESGGSYGLGDVHARGAFAGAKLRAHNLCGSISKGCWEPTFGLNALRLSMDLGFSPEEIMAALPDYRVRLLQDDTPEKRQQVFSQAAVDGVKFSQKQYRSELHLDEPEDADDVVGGEAQSVPQNGALVSGVEAASEGAQAPGAEAAAQKALAPPAEETKAEAKGAANLELTATAQAAIVTVNEARATLGLGKIDGGDAFIVEHIAKHSGTVAEAAHAEAGGDEAAGARQAFQRSGAAAAGRGVMVALYPPKDLAGELAQPGGEPADQLHVTLAYLGHADELGDLGPLRAALAALAVGREQLAGTIGGIGLFPASDSSEGRAVAWAPVDIPGLAELRQAVVRVLRALELEPSTAHGWTPHLTLGYLAPDAAPPAPVPPLPVRFADLYLVIGGERVRFPLKETT